MGSLEQRANYSFLSVGLNARRAMKFIVGNAHGQN